MDRRVDAHIARTQFGQIMDRAVENHERFIVDRRGEPAVVMMSVQDFINAVVPAPQWLQKGWADAKKRDWTSLERRISTPKSRHTGERNARRTRRRNDPRGHRNERSHVGHDCALR